MSRRYDSDFVLQAEKDLVVLYNTRGGDWQEVERFASSPTLEQVLRLIGRRELPPGFLRWESARSLGVDWQPMTCDAWYLPHILVCCPLDPAP